MTAIPQIIFLKYSWKTNITTKPVTHYALRTLWRKDGVGYDFYSSRASQEDFQNSLDHYLEINNLTMDDVYFAESCPQAVEVAKQYNIPFDLPTAVLFSSTDTSDKKYFSVAWAQDEHIVGEKFTTQDTVRKNYPKNHSRSNLSFALEKAGLPSDEKQMMIISSATELDNILPLMS